MPKDRAIVVESNDAGSIGSAGRQTLESMKNPPMADGGVEAVVGAAQGRNPELVLSAERREAEDDRASQTSAGSSIFSKIKRLADGKKRSGSIKTDHSVEAVETGEVETYPDQTPMPRANPEQDPLSYLQPDATVLPPSTTKLVTDENGRPVPTEIKQPERQAKGDNSSVVSAGTSLKEELSDTLDLAPSTSEDKYHTLFAGAIPDDEELIEDYHCALVRDILVQGKLYVSENFLAFRANILGQLCRGSVELTLQVLTRRGCHWQAGRPRWRYHGRRSPQLKNA